MRYWGSPFQIISPYVHFPNSYFLTILRPNFNSIFVSTNFHFPFSDTPYRYGSLTTNGHDFCSAYLQRNILYLALKLNFLTTGGDPSLTDTRGRAVNEEVYEDKGKLVFDNKYRVADLPGLWVAGRCL